MTGLASLDASRDAVSTSLDRIRAASRVAAGTWGGRFLFGSLAFVYLLLYLVGVGDLFITAAPGELTVRLGGDPLHAFAVDGLGRFGGIGVVYLGGLGLTYLFSPIDLLVAVVLAGLAGANAAVTYSGLRLPSDRRLPLPTAALAGVPPIVVTLGCLGPMIVVLADVDAGRLAQLALRALVPIGALLLYASLARVSRHVVGPHD